MSLISYVGLNRTYFVTKDGEVVDGPYSERETALRAVEALKRLSKTRTRKCITCSENFVSEGAHNRMCDGCRSRNTGGEQDMCFTHEGRNRRAVF